MRQYGRGLLTHFSFSLAEQLQRSLCLVLQARPRRQDAIPPFLKALREDRTRTSDSAHERPSQFSDGRET